MEFIQLLLPDDAGGVSLALLIIFMVADKFLLPFYKLQKQQGDNQRQIVQVASADMQRNDATVGSLISLLSENLTSITGTLGALKDNAIRQTVTLDEINITTRDTHSTVGGLPITLEQRFNQLEIQNKRTQNMIYWVMKHHGYEKAVAGSNHNGSIQ